MTRAGRTTRAGVGDELIAALADRGLLGLYADERYGGQGLSQTGYCRIMEEFGAADGSHSIVMGVHSPSA